MKVSYLLWRGINLPVEYTTQWYAFFRTPLILLLQDFQEYDHLLCYSLEKEESGNCELGVQEPRKTPHSLQWSEIQNYDNFYWNVFKKRIRIWQHLNSRRLCGAKRWQLELIENDRNGKQTKIRWNNFIIYVMKYHINTKI